jgi:MFS transporter, DHA3 family, multidrug efflux protein
MKTFYAILANSLTAFLSNTFVWFAVTFWMYLETKSVVATSIMAGVYTATVAVSGFFLGSLVDRYKKKTAILLSSGSSLLLYVLAWIIYSSTPPEVFKDASNPLLWAFIVLVLFGAIAGNMRSIALSTLVAILIPEEMRAKANGMVVTLLAMRSTSYHALSRIYQQQALETGLLEASA